MPAWPLGSIYVPKFTAEKFDCSIEPANYCCSCCIANCCQSCDLRRSVLVGAVWQAVAGGMLGSVYTIVTSYLINHNQELREPIALTVLIYLMVYGWFYFVTGCVGCFMALDAQGISTYEPRVLALGRAYCILCVLCTLGHLNVVGFNSSALDDAWTAASVALILGPILLDIYITYLAFSFLIKFKQQREASAACTIVICVGTVIAVFAYMLQPGIFRGKPVMWHQRKPDQVLELHDAHQLQLRPPPDQVINPLVHLRPGAGAAAEVEAGWAAGRSGRGAAVAGGVPLPPMGAGQAGANVPGLTRASLVHSDTSSLWNVRDSSVGSVDSSHSSVLQQQQQQQDLPPPSRATSHFDGSPGPGSMADGDLQQAHMHQARSGLSGLVRSMVGGQWHGGGAPGAAGGGGGPGSSGGPGSYREHTAPPSVVDGPATLTAIQEEDMPSRSGHYARALASAREGPLAAAALSPPSEPQQPSHHAHHQLLPLPPQQPPARPSLHHRPDGAHGLGSGASAPIELPAIPYPDWERPSGQSRASHASAVRSSSATGPRPAPSSLGPEGSLAHWQQQTTAAAPGEPLWSPPANVHSAGPGSSQAASHRPDDEPVLELRVHSLARFTGAAQQGGGEGGAERAQQGKQQRALSLATHANRHQLLLKPLAEPVVLTCSAAGRGTGPFACRQARGASTAPGRRPSGTGQQGQAAGSGGEDGVVGGTRLSMDGAGTSSGMGVGSGSGMGTGATVREGQGPHDFQRQSGAVEEGVPPAPSSGDLRAGIANPNRLSSLRTQPTKGRKAAFLSQLSMQRARTLPHAASPRLPDGPSVDSPQAAAGLPPTPSSPSAANLITHNHHPSTQEGAATAAAPQSRFAPAPSLTLAPPTSASHAPVHRQDPDQGRGQAPGYAGGLLRGVLHSRASRAASVASSFSAGAGPQRAASAAPAAWGLLPWSFAQQQPLPPMPASPGRLPQRPQGDVTTQLASSVSPSPFDLRENRPPNPQHQQREHEAATGDPGAATGPSLDGSLPPLPTASSLLAPGEPNASGPGPSTGDHRRGIRVTQSTSHAHAHSHAHTGRVQATRTRTHDGPLQLQLAPADPQHQHAPHPPASPWGLHVRTSPSRPLVASLTLASPHTASRGDGPVGRRTTMPLRASRQTATPVHSGQLARVPAAQRPAEVDSEAAAANQRNRSLGLARKWLSQNELREGQGPSLAPGQDSPQGPPELPARPSVGPVYTGSAHAAGQGQLQPQARHWSFAVGSRGPAAVAPRVSDDGGAWGLAPVAVGSAAGSTVAGGSPATAGDARAAAGWAAGSPVAATSTGRRSMVRFASNLSTTAANAASAAVSGAATWWQGGAWGLGRAASAAATPAGSGTSAGAAAAGTYEERRSPFEIAAREAAAAAATAAAATEVWGGRSPRAQQQAQGGSRQGSGGSWLLPGGFLGAGGQIDGPTGEGADNAALRQEVGSKRSVFAQLLAPLQVPGFAQTLYQKYTGRAGAGLEQRQQQAQQDLADGGLLVSSVGTGPVEIVPE